MHEVASCLDWDCYRVLAEQAERTMKDQQTLLEHKESELRSMEEHVRLLEEQVSVVKRASEADRDELSKLRATVAELDREKDELQIAVDEKTEQEASRGDAVATRVSSVILSIGSCWSDICVQASAFPGAKPAWSEH